MARSAVVYLFVDYLGGLSRDPDAMLRGSLSLGDDGLRIETRRRAITMGLAEISSLEVVSEHASRGRPGIGRLFNAVGATAKGSHDRAALLVHLADGETACIRVPGWSEFGLLEHLGPWLERTGLTIAPRAGVQSTAPFSVADELRKLSELRDDGLLSEEEFAAQRAKLLS